MTQPYEPSAALTAAYASQSHAQPASQGEPIGDLSGALKVVERLRAKLRSAVRGRDEVIDLIITAVLADGHVLLEDYPGSGKTTLAKALGESITDDSAADDIAGFRRIQFTPDLLPSDITGTTVFDPARQAFDFRPGPLFAHVVLADEINRTSPKVQAALLEAMAEKQVTVDNTTRKLDALFFVIATQNPLDLAGTFPLPAAQLDRFLFKIRMEHINKEAELDILANLKAIKAGPNQQLQGVTRSEIIAARRVIEEQVYVSPLIHEALVAIAEKTRTDSRILQGISTRSLVLFLPALQARALLCVRDHVTAEDVYSLAYHVLGHRMELAPGAGRLDGAVHECVRAPLEALAQATLRR